MWISSSALTYASPATAGSCSTTRRRPSLYISITALTSSCAAVFHARAELTRHQLLTGHASAVGVHHLPHLAAAVHVHPHAGTSNDRTARMMSMP